MRVKIISADNPGTLQERVNNYLDEAKYWHSKVLDIKYAVAKGAKVGCSDSWSAMIITE